MSKTHNIKQELSQFSKLVYKATENRDYDRQLKKIDVINVLVTQNNRNSKGNIIRKSS